LGTRLIGIPDGCIRLRGGSEGAHNRIVDREGARRA
jgi:hypothetical protein